MLCKPLLFERRFDLPVKDIHRWRDA
jgi:hypothetical protein